MKLSDAIRKRIKYYLKEKNIKELNNLEKIEKYILKTIKY